MLRQIVGSVQQPNHPGVVPTKHAHKNADKYDGYIILTDGYAPQPDPARLRRVWVITVDGEMQFPARGDVVIKMKRETKSEAA